MKLAEVGATLLARLFPRAKDRRALAIGGAAMGSIALLGRGLPAWREWDDASRRGVDDSRRELAIARVAVASHRASVQSKAVLARQLDSLSRTYAEASGAAVAGAALATLVSSIATESGVRVTSASVRPDSATRSVLTRIAVRISATGDVEGLSDYLSSIESSEQLLAVRELSVAQADPGAPDSRAEALHFEILVEGLFRLDVKDHVTAPSIRHGASPSRPVKQ